MNCTYFYIGVPKVVILLPRRDRNTPTTAASWTCVLEEIIIVSLSVLVARKRAVVVRLSQVCLRGVRADLVVRSSLAQTFSPSLLPATILSRLPLVGLLASLPPFFTGYGLVGCHSTSPAGSHEELDLCVAG